MHKNVFISTMKTNRVNITGGVHIFHSKNGRGTFTTGAHLQTHGASGHNTGIATGQKPPISNYWSITTDP